MAFFHMGIDTKIKILNTYIGKIHVLDFQEGFTLVSVIILKRRFWISSNFKTGRLEVLNSPWILKIGGLSTTRWISVALCSMAF